VGQNNASIILVCYKEKSYRFIPQHRLFFEIHLEAIKNEVPKMRI
jgi:hypothetical protein